MLHATLVHYITLAKRFMAKKIKRTTSARHAYRQFELKNAKFMSVYFLLRLIVKEKYYKKETFFEKKKYLFLQE